MATSTQQFTTDGSWVCPIGVTSVTVVARGAGGGGGSVSTNTDNRSAGAGAGGQYAVKVCTVVPGTSYAIDIGAAGTAGTAAGNGGTGGDTTFATNVVVAKGGVGGQSFENGYQGGTGATTNGVGDTVRKGGNGGDGGSFNGSGGGGEGACSDKDGGNGGDGSAGVAGAAGTGGDGGDGAIGKTNASGTAGGAGTAPGGGGSGGVVGTSDTNRNGGAGAIGQVDLSWTTPVIAALVDNFNDNSIDAAKWVKGESGSTISETNGQIEILLPNGADGTFSSVDTYDLTSSQATIKLVDAGTATSYYSILRLGSSTSSWVGFYLDGGDTLSAQSSSGSLTSTAYNSTNHKYFRIRESGGNTYWDTSADGTTWNNFTSTANPVTLTAVKVLNEYASYDGYATTTVKVDSFNILPETSVLDRTKAKLLCHFNGTLGQHTYTSDDANARTATFSGIATPILSTTQKVFGTASLLLASATSDYLTFPDSDDWAFGTGDFTIGFRVRFNSIDGNSQYAIGWAEDDSNRGGLLFNSTTINFWWKVASSSVFDYSVATTLSTGSFYNVELDRSGNTWYIFLNGTLLGSTTSAATFRNWASLLYIGQYGLDGYYLDGYIDELYIINGQALHTSMYEPLDVEYSLSAAATGGQMTTNRGMW